MDYKLVVHAGGKGTRLRPLTLNIPKVLVPVHDKVLLDYALKPWLDAGIKDVIVTTSFMAGLIKSFFDQHYEGLNVKYIHEVSPSGRAGAVRLGLEQGVLEEDGQYVMINGDDIIDFSPERLFSFHESHEGEATLILSNKYNNPYGVVKMSENKVLDFTEKPLTLLPEGEGINTGAVIFKNLRRFKEIGVPSHYEDSVHPILARENKLFAFFADGWNSVNTKSEYEAILKKLA